WVKSDNIINIKGKDINKHKAEYSNMGVETYTECRYSSIDNESIYLDLKIIRFTDVLDAYAFFFTTVGFNQWMPDNNKDEYKDDSIYTSRKGDYVVFVHNTEQYPFLRKEMAQLIKIVDYNLDNYYSHKELPYLQKFLKNFTGNNVFYTKGNLPEFQRVDNAFYSKTGLNNAGCTVFISDRGSFSNAFNLYRSMVEKEKYITVEAFERHSAFLKINEKNYRFISVNGNIITGLWECSSIQEAEALLNKINNSIEKKNTGK
ncbi:MAG: hypothetical protein WDA74_02190, partial [Spirochaetota bacterium]